MATRPDQSGFGELRQFPIEKRIRAVLGGETVVDTTRARIVWEPRRIVPQYAVPEAELEGELSAGEALPDPGAPTLHPGFPFAVHSTPGEPLQVGAAGAFRPADPDLAGYVILDFKAFDAWYEEDERTYAHVRDPFHRIDILQSSRPARVEADGVVLAESSAPVLLFETRLPMRTYFARDEVDFDALAASDLRTWCAYKGEANYWKRDVELAWSYETPQREAAAITDRVAFFDERVDVSVDGVARARPVTQWS